MQTNNWYEIELFMLAIHEAIWFFANKWDLAYPKCYTQTIPLQIICIYHIYIYIYIYRIWYSITHKGWYAIKPNKPMNQLNSSTTSSNLLSILLRCGARPNEWGTQWDSNSLLQVCLLNLLIFTLFKQSTADLNWEFSSH